MVGFLLFISLSAMIILSYFHVITQSKQVRETVEAKEAQANYFHEFVKNHFNAYISPGIGIPSVAGVSDLINAGILPKNFPRDYNFQAKAVRNACNPNLYDVIYLTNNPIDLMDSLLRLDWSFAEKENNFQDPCRPGQPAFKIDYAINGIGRIYGYNVGNNYTGNYVVLVAPKQVGYLIFKLGWTDMFPFYIHGDRGYCWVHFEPFIQYEGFSNVCPISGINIDQQDYINFLGARHRTSTYGYVPPTTTICIPVLKSDYVSNIVRLAETRSELNQVYSNQHGIDLSDVANYFVYPSDWCPNSITGVPFIARSYASIVRSSLTNKYYFIFVGALYTATGNWNETRDGFPVFRFDSNLGQIAHGSLIRIAMSFNENETRTVETTNNSYVDYRGNRPAPDSMIHRIVFNKDRVEWYIGYYDRAGNKREGLSGKRAIVPFGRNY